MNLMIINLNFRAKQTTETELKKLLTSNVNSEVKSAIELGMQIGRDVDSGKTYQDAVTEKYAFAYKKDHEHILFIFIILELSK